MSLVVANCGKRLRVHSAPLDAITAGHEDHVLNQLKRPPIDGTLAQLRGSHVAYAREWSARFGARLVALRHDVLEFEVSRPINARKDAVAMAAVHAYYCSGTPIVSSTAQHAAYLLAAP
jgi:hypothetical protein